MNTIMKEKINDNDIHDSDSVGKKSELNHRKNIYTFLMSVYYREIDKEKTRVLVKQGVLESFNRAGYKFDTSFFEDFTQEKENELAREYTRIFIGPGNHLPPYESIHNKNDKDYGRLWGETTSQIKKYLEHFGLSFNGVEYHGIPDHVGTEFEFMALLLDSQIKALKENDPETSGKLFQIQRDFFVEHINQWVPGFMKKLGLIARHNFYQEIAKLTLDFMQSEEEFYKSK